MRWYIASRTKHRQLVSSIARILSAHGHTLVFDWTAERLLVPYSDYPSESGDMAGKIVRAVQDADIFVLLSDEGGTDMFIELGIALAGGTAKVYVVGAWNDRSLLHFHPAIQRVDTVTEIFSKECPELLPYWATITAQA